MCGDSSRVSRGGLIAVIHPVPNASCGNRRPSLKTCHLHLSNNGSDHTLSQLHYENNPALMAIGSQRLEVRIQLVMSANVEGNLKAAELS